MKSAQEIAKNNLKKIALWMLGNDKTYVLKIANENLFLDYQGKIFARSKKTNVLRTIKTARKFNTNIRKDNLSTYYFIINEFMNGRVKKVEA